MEKAMHEIGRAIDRVLMGNHPDHTMHHIAEARLELEMTLLVEPAARRQDGFGEVVFLLDMAAVAVNHGQGPRAVQKLNGALLKLERCGVTR